MKRWNMERMLAVGHKLFAKIVRRKKAVNHNHEIHFLAREINDWLPRGIQSLIKGSYTPRHLKRHYFADEMVDQLHTSDRVLQHILLQELKPTFKHVMSKNCYHLQGPSGVKYATQRIRQILQDEKPQYVLRADIKSYYRSILHFKLVNDIRELYDDPKVQAMLEEVIRNPIETPRGYKNPSTGIALRGPLSQFFSAIYLKKLDDAFDGMQVSYLRFQDDYIILCKTKRQLNRCKRRMMEVLHERGLSISRKKSYMGCISRGFHFLGIHYFPTQMENNITVAHALNDKNIQSDDSVLPTEGGGRSISKHSQPESMRITPHPRTLRKAREQIKLMVTDGFLPKRIKNYLHRWLLWWVNTSETWQYETLLESFVESCWQLPLVEIIYDLRQVATTLSGTESVVSCDALAA